MVNNENLNGNDTQVKKDYQIPSIRSIGSVVEITKGGNGNGGDLNGSRIIDYIQY